ncbi:hypothetical protein NM688_g2822 [Phlebia brevispora]|uniref:Uncharacterized protein n=1 Tax=Phlebia brevispora TaxID=194682 RepID=A0ACC1T7M3_9APHY|nr:hypothetical protein NM688_g2822 [Phlebia brevispora]
MLYHTRHDNQDVTVPRYSNSSFSVSRSHLCDLLWSHLSPLLLAVGECLSARVLSPVTLQFAKAINATGLANILERDLARIKALKERKRPVSSQQDWVPVNVPATNVAISYVVSVGFGTPPTFYDLIVDTGSSTTWCGANPDKPYVVTSSSVDTGYEVYVEYGSGWMDGEEYNDTVTIGSLVIPSQGIGAAHSSSGFDGVDGVLGLTMNGYKVVDTAFLQGLIPAHSVAISFEPADSAPVTNGEVTFGGVDTSKLIGEIAFTPTVTGTSQSSLYWGISQSISYNDVTILSPTIGIVDSGTTLQFVATDAFQLYCSLTGASFDDITELATITNEQYDNLSDLVFTIGGTEFVLTPNAQIWPRSLNAAIGGSPGNIYLILQDIGSPSGAGFDFINGQVFLERFYSVFDTANSRVGIATTPLTYSVVN